MAIVANNKKVSLKGLSWNYSPEEISRKTDELIAKLEEVRSKINLVNVADATCDNVLLPLAYMEAETSTLRNCLAFYQQVHPDKDKRDASTEANKKLSTFAVKMSMDKDTFDRMNAVNEAEGTKEMIENDMELGRLLKRIVKNGKRNGLHLDESLRKEVEQIKSQESELGITYKKNLTDENTKLSFNKNQLKGLDDDFINSLNKNEDGTYQLTLQYPHYFPLMKKCCVTATRKTMQKAFDSRCKDSNSNILQQLVDLRRKKATLLGYDSHAAYIHEMRMAKKASNVEEFLTSLAKKLKPLGKKDLDLMLKYKKEDCEKSGEPFDGKINMWDYKFYCTKVEEELYSVDQNEIKQYFPMETVTEGLLGLYENLLGLKYKKVDNAEVWHPDVTLYEVVDQKSDLVIGHFYLDLYPRDGKYGHAACFGLTPGCLNADGTRQNSVAAMVANFTKPTSDKPSLLIHYEVETYFHEFGHVMHQICAEARYARFSGTSVERDFVEAPSQMLENWCWEKEPLLALSNHYKTNEKLPDSMMEKLIASRNANAGVINLRQIALATLDFTLHTMKTTPDVAKVYADCCENIIGIPATEGTCMPANFGHLAGGYDAQYYGYMWSEVFCFDMFMSRFKKEGVLSSKVGMDYRNCILKPGGSVDATEMLQNFLGRKPNQDAFLKAKGLTQ